MNNNIFRNKLNFRRDSHPTELIISLPGFKIWVSHSNAKETNPVIIMCEAMWEQVTVLKNWTRNFFCSISQDFLKFLNISFGCFQTILVWFWFFLNLPFWIKPPSLTFFISKCQKETLWQSSTFQIAEFEPCPVKFQLWRADNLQQKLF